MATGRFVVAYYRVSTAKQGASGLGLEAQREAVKTYLNGGARTLVDEFTEVESGTHNDRPALAKALERCRQKNATLVIAKLDRLARNVRFLLSVVEGSGEGGVVFCDLPSIPGGPVGKFMVTQMAAVAELEAGLIGQRTKAALQAAKVRGVVLGGYRGGPRVDGRLGGQAAKVKAQKHAEGLRQVVKPLRGAGASLRQIAAALTAQGYATPRGGQWSADAVRAVLLRLGA